MNTLYFYTDSKVCEASPVIPDCRYFKKILIENSWPYTLIDLNNNPQQFVELQTIVGKPVSLPQFIIRDSIGNVLHYFNSLSIKLNAQTGLATEEEFIFAVTPILEEKLKEFEVI